ncbi:helix-turn-helix domain-containing protein [Brevibacillus antibioticus]|uniref:Helix-turn-helix domain-containing protein n=1 Tax=Brevibacillus antibioticus TaxID=2570228 RepID=A0A4U2YA86_9BACL|nr:helix-turn-helix domain-containing protein [Brevibacillus antibioticus]TKI56251.1 helix-turn-helix domain-containing protein [Brevibacillus antibioticus]
MNKSVDILEVIVQQLLEDDRLVKMLIPRLLERLGTRGEPTIEKWLTVNEAAKILNISSDMIYLIVREGTLQAARLGSISSRKPAIRFQLSKLNAWMEAGGVSGSKV